MIYLLVHVYTRSGRTAYSYDQKSGKLKVYLKAAPERGAANHELISAFAEWLKLPKRAIDIASGHAFRIKRLAIDAPMTQEDLMRALEISIQSTLFK